MTEQNNNKPIKSFKAGGVEASVWRKEVEQNGQTVTRHSVRIQKQYRNKDGDYEKTEYFFKNDLPMLELVTRKAFEYLALKESQDAEVSAPI